MANTTSRVVKSINKYKSKYGGKRMIEIDYIISKGNKFYLQLANENVRFKSWEYCYKSFQMAYKNQLDKETIDYLSLQLSFYLASWGMYRGSSFLLELDYKIHEYVVKLLFKYKTLWETRINADLNQNFETFYKELFELIIKIKKYYSEKRASVKKDNPPKSEISDTLVSKILLGTIGCVSAYDRYFISSLDLIDGCQKKLNKNSVESLIKYYKKHFKKFESLRNKMSSKDLEYSQMKVLDSCFWQYGYDLEP